MRSQQAGPDIDRPARHGLIHFNAGVIYRKLLTIRLMDRERIILPRKVREYFAEIGRRGGAGSRRELTRSQAKLLVAIREAKRAAKKEGKPPPKVHAKHLALLRKPTVRPR